MTREQEKKLDEIYVSIVGNPSMGQRGLAERVKNLEEYKKKDQAMKSKVAGGLAVGTPLFIIIVEYIKHKLFE